MNLHKLIQTHLLQRSWLSYTLFPVGFLYGGWQRHRRAKWEKKAWEAPCRVISIGNIVSGGSGKTPLTIALAKLLQVSGYQVGISHRGYKGAFETSAMLISEDGRILYPAWQCGDEAYLIASALPSVPVVVGRNRTAAIKLLLRKHPQLDYVIMDDALQHVKVKRQLDIVSFSAITGIGNGFVIPAGYLREPLLSLNPKSLAVIYHPSDRIIEPDWVTRLHSRKINVTHSFATVQNCCDAIGNSYSIESLKGKRLILVSGIAHPDSFEQSVRDMGLSFGRHFRFPDHYSFADPKLSDELCLEQPDTILCTQKDLMKLAAHDRLKPRLRALVLDYTFYEPELVLKACTSTEED